MLLRNFFFHALDTITQPVLGKFPIKAKISMTISNNVQYVWYEMRVQKVTEDNNIGGMDGMV
jgi:hypothetical protein